MLPGVRIVFSAVMIGLLVGVGTPAFAGAGGAGSDLDQIRDVVARQLTALRRKRGEEAYRLASPEIQRQFPNLASFMGMVRASYGPLLGHRRFTFMDVQTTPTGFTQGVRLIDASGVPWIALYTVEKQPDGNWTISGCQIVRASAEAPK